MTGTSLTEISTDRWAMIQRMAQAFCKSDLVPDTMKDSVSNCTVALLMAEQMHENPLTVMQSLFFVYGRPGWIASYMVSRANQSGKFIGPLRWRSEGTGDDLSVTCYARLRDAPAEDNLVEISITMKMAHADGWTQRWDKKLGKKVPAEKYQSIPEQMLRWRSATWLIRLYAPEVMHGLHTVDELEDTADMKDVTPPPKLGIDSFKPGRKPPAAVIDAERPAQAVGQELPGESALTPIQDETYYTMAEGLRTAATDRDALNAAWAKMQPDRDELLRAGRGDLTNEIDRYYDQLLRPLPIPPAAAAEQINADPLGIIADWSSWRQQFDHDMRLCLTKDDLGDLIDRQLNDIAAYNHAMPRAAAIFSKERDQRMEELPPNY